MNPEIPPDVCLVKPWEPVGNSGEGFVRELQNEMSPEHILYGVPVVAVACRIDNDDVLFATADPSKPLALVHLVWQGREFRAAWPWTAIYQSWQEWIDHCLLPTHLDYRGDG
jgi:hypothetical protein